MGRGAPSPPPKKQTKMAYGTHVQDAGRRIQDSGFRAGRSDKVGCPSDPHERGPKRGLMVGILRAIRTYLARVRLGLAICSRRSKSCEHRDKFADT